MHHIHGYLTKNKATQKFFNVQSYEEPQRPTPLCLQTSLLVVFGPCFSEHLPCPDAVRSVPRLCCGEGNPPVPKSKSPSVSPPWQTELPLCSCGVQVSKDNHSTSVRSSFPDCPEPFLRPSHCTKRVGRS